MTPEVIKDVPEPISMPGSEDGPIDVGQPLGGWPAIIEQAIKEAGEASSSPKVEGVKIVSEQDPVKRFLVWAFGPKAA